MRLEPVWERPPQHASGGARRAALHYEVLAVEEICGVIRIEGHGREPRKRRELRPGPLPPVPHKIMNPKRARARGMRADRRGIPRFEIEISPGSAWRFLAPRITALPRAVGRSIPGTMKLRLGRQFAPEPFRIRSGLRLPHLTCPLARQTNLAKHPSSHPHFAFP